VSRSAPAPILQIPRFFSVFREEDQAAHLRPGETAREPAFAKRARPDRSVPHPVAFFLATGWETTNPNPQICHPEPQAKDPLRSLPRTALSPLFAPKLRPIYGWFTLFGVS